MTTLTLNGEGLTFTAPFASSTSYTQQAWGGNWSSAYFTEQWYGQNLTYTAGSVNPSSGTLTSITISSPTTGQTIWSVSGTSYVLQASDIGTTADSIALAMLASSTTPIYINGGTGNDSMAWYAPQQGLRTTIDGGMGLDVLTFSQNFSNYQFTNYNSANSSISVHSISANVDATLIGIEKFVFRDTTATLSSLTTPIPTNPSTNTTSGTVNVINATTGNDNLIGTSAIDQISAGAGNDLITGSSGNDTIDGGVGVDTLTYAGTYATFSVANGANGAFTLASTKFGSDSVTNVERFKFTDKCFANDVSGAAGNAAKVITAAFGKAYVPQFLAIGLTLADSGQSIDSLCETVTNAELVESTAGDSTTSGYVAAIFNNVVGRAPNVLESNSFVSMIDTGSISRLGLLELAAKHSMVSDTVNSLNVELLGIPYDPGF